jgi:hypothetical protein
MAQAAFAVGPRRRRGHREQDEVDVEPPSLAAAESLPMPAARPCRRRYGRGACEFGHDRQQAASMVRSARSERRDRHAPDRWSRPAADTDQNFARGKDAQAVEHILIGPVAFEEREAGDK